MFVRRNGAVSVPNSRFLSQIASVFGVAGEGVGQFGPEERVVIILADDVVGISVQELLGVEVGGGHAVGVAVMSQVLLEFELAVEGAAVLVDLADDSEFVGGTDLFD